MALLQRPSRQDLLRLSLVLIALSVTGAAFFAAGSAYRDWRSLPATELVLADPMPVPRFPLRAEAGRRYLVDAGGAPFLMHGDTAWSLIADLTREEVDIYLADRRARGFNTLLVNLLEHKFARNAPNSIYGDAPFTEPGNFGAPNEAYFKHADWVLGRARDMGFLVLLTPAYIGWLGEGDGWWQTMLRTDPEVLRGYGRYLGERYGGFGNIVWVNAGDHDPPDKSRVEAIAEGLKSAAPQQLHTAHNAPETFVPDFWGDAGWLDLVSVYSYQPVCPSVAAAYRHQRARPAFLIESAYEGEHGADARRLRRQAYSALLCGASGQVFGNNPIWHFRGPGIFPARADWFQSLGSEGARSMTHLADLFRRLPWWELQPDLAGEILAEGSGADDDQAVAALTADRSLALIYLPARREIAVDAARLAGTSVAPRWIDPTNGREADVGSAFDVADGLRRFSPPGRNAGGDGDWLLLLRSSARGQ